MATSIEAANVEVRNMELAAEGRKQDRELAFKLANLKATREEKVIIRDFMNGKIPSLLSDLATGIFLQLVP